MTGVGAKVSVAMGLFKSVSDALPVCVTIFGSLEVFRLMARGGSREGRVSKARSAATDCFRILKQLVGERAGGLIAHLPRTSPYRHSLLESQQALQDVVSEFTDRRWPEYTGHPIAGAELDQALDQGLDLVESQLAEIREGLDRLVELVDQAEGLLRRARRVPIAGGALTVFLPQSP